MEAYWGSGGIAPLILWPRHWMEVSGQLHAPADLLPGKEPLVPIGQEVGWVPVPFWMQWWREKFPAPAGNWTLNPDRPACNPVLYQLSYHSSLFWK
jgi:hypothetical protein